MELPSLLLDNPHYTEYVNGKEIEVDVNLIKNKNVMEGDHIMVYKDTIASFSDVSLPRREQQSEYIGVEGRITKLNTIRDRDQNFETVQSLFVRKL